jgi:hypothetical protein
MSHLRSSIKTMSNAELTQKNRDLIILNNIRNNTNNNYKICCDEVLNSASYDLYMSVVKAESMVNIMKQDIKHITTNSDEYPFNYKIYNCKCNNNQKVLQKLSSPCISLNSKLFLSNQC